jgi:hypothetical protein
LVPLPEDGLPSGKPPTGVLNRLNQGLNRAGWRLWDSLNLFIAANVVPLVGHATLWPLSALAGGLAVKDFMQGSGYGAQALKKLPQQARTWLQRLEQPFFKGQVSGRNWLDKSMPVIFASIGLFLAGLLIHPLLILALPLMTMTPNLAYTGGFLKGFARQVSKQIGKAF